MHSLLISLFLLFASCALPQNPPPRPASQTTTERRQPNQKSQGHHQQFDAEQRGSEASPLFIKMLPNEQASDKGLSNRSSPWGLSDKIAVIATVAAFLQFVALAVTILVMISSSRRQLRAYVGGDVGSIGNVANPIPVAGQDIKPTGAEITNPTCGPVAYVQIKNAGQTPAYEVLHWGNMCTREHPLTSALPPSQFTLRFASVLGPGIIATKYLFLATPLTAQEISDLRAGKAAIYVYGEIRYKDAFGKERFTKYRLMHHVGQGAIGVSTGLTFADEGNEAN